MAVVQRKPVNQEQSFEEKVDKIHFYQQLSGPNSIKKSRFFVTTEYDANIALNENETRDPIVDSISCSIRSSSHIAMDDKTSNAARNYYKHIVNDDRTNYDMKRLKIYLDLVLGSKAQLS